MSYLADAVAKKELKDAGVYDFDAEAEKMSAGQSAENQAEFMGPQAAKPALAPAEPDPKSFTYDAPADTPANQEQIKRFATAGVSQNETYRLLGGPRQKLGA